MIRMSPECILESNVYKEFHIIIKGGECFK